MIHEPWQQYLERSAAQPASQPPGLAYLPDLAALRFGGSDARSFLQGYLTCDTRDLEPGRLTATALCNLKGRVVMNGWCAPEGDQDVLLVLHRSLTDTLATFLRPYLMFSRKTSLTDLRDHVLLLGSLDLDTSEAGQAGLVLDQRRRLFAVAELSDARAMWERHPHLSDETWLGSLAADGVPLISAPVSETFLPQMLDLDTLGAIDFEKGCYLGQEVVARAQHRGQVKRRLVRLTWEGPAAPLPGADVTDATGRSQGVVVQSAAAGSASGPLLAVLRQEAPDELHQGSANLRRVS